MKKIDLVLIAVWIIILYIYLSNHLYNQSECLNRIEQNQYTIMVESLISDNVYYHIIELLGDECSDKEIWEYYQKNINKLEIQSVWVIE